MQPGSNSPPKSPVRKGLFQFARLQKKLRPWLLTTIVAFILMQVLLFSPASVEQTDYSIRTKAMDPEIIIRSVGTDGKTLAPGIPRGVIPDYSINGYKYVSAKGGVKQWKLAAERAHMFNHERLVHATTVVAWIYDPDGKATEIHGKEARYFMNQKDLEIFGDVITTFSDGFTVTSEYVRYKPQLKDVEVTQEYAVQGQGKVAEEKTMRFTSSGLNYRMGENEVILPSNVHFEMERDQPIIKKSTEEGVPPEKIRDITKIDSDECRIDRRNSLAHFGMNPARPNDKRFVEIRQPQLYVKSRKATMNYGNSDAKDMLSYMTANEDVFIQEKTEDDTLLRYGTCGQADFDAKQNLIVLTKFPQVYQNNDTVTGEVIVIHRDTDLVDVKQSNAFSEGKDVGTPADSDE